MINAADAVIVAAGAGMSFESGLDDILEEGFARKFPSLAKKGYKTMLDMIPTDFKNDSLLSWGYYAYRMKWYRDSDPHSGYFDLLKIVQQKKK